MNVRQIRQADEKSNILIKNDINVWSDLQSYFDIYEAEDTIVIYDIKKNPLNCQQSKPSVG